MDAIIEAEKVSEGKVFVGYQRRYAPAFLDAVKEVGGLEEIQYARVRDIIGLNSQFVNQSGTFPKKFTDFSKEDTRELLERDDEIVREALESDYDVKATLESMEMLKLLGSLVSNFFEL